MYEEFVKERITQLRLEHNISEYKLSLDLGQNRSYIQAISSGRALPSMSVFFNICEYFDITPSDFFNEDIPLSQNYKKAVELLNSLDNSKIKALIPLLEILNEK